MKKSFKLSVYNLLRDGVSPVKIAERFGMSLPRLQYYLSSLKKDKLIKKVGYGVWKVYDRKNISIKKKKKLKGGDGSHPSIQVYRFHNIMIKIYIPRSILWDNYIRKYNKFKRLKRGGYKIDFNTHIIHFWKNTIIIYITENIIGNSLVELRKILHKWIIKIIHNIEFSFDVNLGFKDNNYLYDLCSGEIALVNHDYAKAVNHSKDKVMVGDRHGVWLKVDKSFNVDELEVLKNRDPNNFQLYVDSHNVVKYWNDIKKHDFEVDSSFVLKLFAKLAESQLKQNENINKLFDLLGNK